MDEFDGEKGEGGGHEEGEGHEDTGATRALMDGRFGGRRLPLHLCNAESLPTRVVEILRERIEGGDLGEAGELSIQKAFDRREADEDAGAGFDGIGEVLQVTLYEAGGIGEAGLFA